MANYKNVLNIVKGAYNNGKFNLTPEMFDKVEFSTKRSSNTPREVTVNNAVFQAAVYLNMAGAKISRKDFMELVRANCMDQKNIKLMEDILNHLGVGENDLVPSKIYGHKKTGVAINITQKADDIKAYLEDKGQLTVEPTLVYPEAGRSGATNKSSSIGMDFEDFSFGDDEEE